MNVKQDAQSTIRRSIGKISKTEIYNLLVDKYNLSRKVISAYYLELVKKGLINDEAAIPPVNFPPSEVKKLYKEGFSQQGDTAEITKTVYKRIKTLDDLVEACDIDLTIWEIASWECNKWEVGRKDKTVDLSWLNGVSNGSVDDSGKVFVEPLFQVKAKLKLRKLDNDLAKQKDVLLKELFTNSAKIKPYEISRNEKDKYAYEISLPDVHFGKFSWSEESGEDYDLKIASSRFNEAIAHFTNLVDTNKIERIILPIGNDLINIDSRKGETTAGTRVDSDTRFFKIVKTVKSLLIENIDKLSLIAPVDIIIIAGNHDYETMWMLGEMLEAYYHNNENIIIDNSPKQRKYYKYGKNGFLYTHGNEEKHADLGLIFATENPILWASSTAGRAIKLGHFHKNKKLSFITVDEHTGFTIQILPSLSGTDYWHNSKGYMSKKAAKSFLYDKDKGLIAEYTYTL